MSDADQRPDAPADAEAEKPDQRRPSLAAGKLTLWAAALMAGAALIVLTRERFGEHEWAVAWLRRYEGHAPWAFCWRFALEWFAVCLAFSAVCGLAEGAARRALGFPKSHRPKYGSAP